MRILGIVVLYNEHTDEVLNNLFLVAKQVDVLYLVDNSSDSYIDLYSKISNVVYKPLFANMGIAAAQNFAIQYAIENHFDFVFFSDPDSCIFSDSVVKMLYSFQKLSDEGLKVGGIGSFAYNQDTGMPYSLDNSFVCNYNANYIETTYLRNSISLIPTSLFYISGGMDESLFIDGVDSEWCWRTSRLLGVHFYINRQVVIQHRLGKTNHKIFGKYYSICSPRRLYFEYRNFIWLKDRDYVPKRWISVNKRKYFIKIFYYSIFVKPRLINLKWIILGIIAGIKSKNIASV